MANKKAIVLLSGGLDSATALYLAKGKGHECFCLIFDYGQRHRREIESAKKIAQSAGCHRHLLKIDLPWRGSSLLDVNLRIPQRSDRIKQRQNSNVPSTYVPARNTVFLSFALSYAETIKAGSVFIGAHTQDYSGYPDCRPDFFRAFSKVALSGTQATQAIKIHAPLVFKTKAEIIKLAHKLDVPLELTWSCYKGDQIPCGECDSCYYRSKGFKEAGIEDPLSSLRRLI
jgi:7-cyano-7-deazaguanine synthase